MMESLLIQDYVREICDWALDDIKRSDILMCLTPKCSTMPNGYFCLNIHYRNMKIIHISDFNPGPATNFVGFLHSDVYLFALYKESGPRLFMENYRGKTIELKLPLSIGLLGVNANMSVTVYENSIFILGTAKLDFSRHNCVTRKRNASHIHPGISPKHPPASERYISCLRKSSIVKILN
jgi:hypothetical protein